MSNSICCRYILNYFDITRNIIYIWYIYAFVATLAFMITYLFVPETKGISLKTIENKLNNGVSTRHFGVENYLTKNNK